MKQKTLTVLCGLIFAISALLLVGLGLLLHQMGVFRDVHSITGNAWPLSGLWISALLCLLMLLLATIGCFVPAKKAFFYSCLMGIFLTLVFSIFAIGSALTYQGI